MTVEKIKEARVLAMKFLHLADELTKSQDAQNQLYGGKLSGSLRRSSLELTRALAEMRKP